jgi:hypothetical protein
VTKDSFSIKDSLSKEKPPLFIICFFYRKKCYCLINRLKYTKIFVMNFSKEVNRTDENFEHDSTQINRGEINKNAIEDHLYDVNEFVDESNDSKHERRFTMPIDTHRPMENNNDADSGDVINCPKNNFEHLQSLSKSQLIGSLLKHDGIVEPYPTPENSLTINGYQHSNIDDNEITNKFHPHLKTKYNFITEHPLDEKENINDEQKIILRENTDWKDLNPYENPPSQLLIHNKRQENSCENNSSILYT